MSIDESLAVNALRRWRRNVQLIRSGKVSRCDPDRLRGRPNSRGGANYHEGRIIAVIDFERSLEAVAPDLRMMLLLVHRDGYSCADAARMLGWSVRKGSYMIVQARLKLASVLDRKGML
jgi:DNA-directed RNA polymerase specialized sigma24 family protein